MPVKAHQASEYLKTPEDIKALRNVAAAQGGVSALARQAKLDRVALSRALSGRRHPRLDTLTKVAAACGVKLQFSA